MKTYFLYSAKPLPKPVFAQIDASTLTLDKNKNVVLLRGRDSFEDIKKIVEDALRSQGNLDGFLCSLDAPKNSAIFGGPKVQAFIKPDES